MKSSQNTKSITNLVSSNTSSCVSWHWKLLVLRFHYWPMKSSRSNRARTRTSSSLIWRISWRKTPRKPFKNSVSSSRRKWKKIKIKLSSNSSAKPSMNSLTNNSIKNASKHSPSLSHSIYKPSNLHSLLMSSSSLLWSSQPTNAMSLLTNSQWKSVLKSSSTTQLRTLNTHKKFLKSSKVSSTDHLVSVTSSSWEFWLHSWKEIRTSSWSKKESLNCSRGKNKQSKSQLPSVCPTWCPSSSNLRNLLNNFTSTLKLCQKPAS